MTELEGALLRMGCYQSLNQSAETNSSDWINSVTTGIGDTKLCPLVAMAAAQIKGKLTELSSYSHYIAAGVGTL